MADSSTSSPPTVSTPIHSAAPIASRTFFFASADLLSFLCRFLSVDELLCCSALSSALHCVVDSNSVWRPRLLQAKHIQSSFVPLEIQPPFVPPPEDDDEEEKQPPPAPRRGSQRRSSSLACPPPSPCPASFDASLAEVAEVCSSHYANALYGLRIQCQILPVAILPFTGPHPATSPEAVPTSPPLALDPSPSSSSSSSFCCVFHLKFLLTRDPYNPLVNKFDCREFVLCREGDWWRVKAMGPPDSGQLVLNAYNMERSDSGLIFITPPAHSTSQPTRTPYKAQYIELMRCSEHSHTDCARLLTPTPALPPPRPTPAWFSQHLAALSFRQQPFPRIPESLYPSFHPLPVCGGCRLGVLAAVLSFCRQFDPMVPELGWQVDCLVRVNGVQWDARWKEFADEIAYDRVSIRWREREEEEGDGDGVGGQEETGEGEGEEGGGGQRMEGVTRRRRGEWCVERMVQLTDDSGVYAINTPSNLPWINPSPPSPATTHPPELSLHEHPLLHYQRSVYRINGYGCDVCEDSHSEQDVWHCQYCQFDCCPAAVHEARQRIANAAEQRVELMKPLNTQDEQDG